MSEAKKFKDWYKDRCGHPLGVNLGMKAVNELEQENAELRELAAMVVNLSKISDVPVSITSKAKQLLNK